MFDHQVFDGDNHYYEAEDAFTRHLDPKLGPRVIEWVQVGKRRYYSIGGKISRAVVNPTFDPVSPAGAMSDYFRGNPDKKLPHEFLTVAERIRPEYRDRDARLTTMDSQGIDKIFLFPTLGMIYEEPLKHDPVAVGMMFKAFNRWVAEDWGFEYKDRIFAAPYISLADVGSAVAELRYALDGGARTVVMRPAAPTTRDGQKPPTHADFDPFWALANEAGITVVVHAGDTGYTSNGYANDGFSSSFKGGIPQPIKFTQMERAIEDFLASLVCDQLFTRFPNLRVASVENGSGFLRGLFGKLNATANKMAGWFSDHPVDAFKENIWINPFWEDDVHELLDLMGPDKILFGSDWPHIEGMPKPLDYLEELEGLDADTIDKITRRNVLELNQLRPA